MIRGMRIANAVLASIFVFGATISFLHDHSTNSEGDPAFIFGYLLGYFGSLALVILPLYLAWRGLSSISTMRLVQRIALARGRLANLLNDALQ